MSDPRKIIIVFFYGPDYYRNTMKSPLGASSFNCNRNVIVYKRPHSYQKNLVDFITAVPNGSF